MDNKKKSRFISEIKSEKRALLGENPIIHILGDYQFVLESYKGILEYSDKYVKIKTYDYCVTVKGCNLELKNMSEGIIGITGKLNSIELC